MILHIVPDDKFIDMAYNTFERASPGKNLFLSVGQPETFTYIKTAPVKTIAAREFLSKKFAYSLLQYDFVVLHWLDQAKMQLVMNAPPSVKFIWIGWGGDYYDYIDRELLLPATKHLYLAHQPIHQTTVIRKIKNFIFRKLFVSNIHDFHQVLNRINYFAPVLEEDYLLVAKNVQNFQPKYVTWNYGTLEDDLIIETKPMLTGNNILIGNSATYENNHLEAFDAIAHLDLQERKIITPLSYGDEQYAKKIIERGKTVFDDAFCPLTEFMSIAQYNRVISTCSVVVMNHLRQQAVGNIVIMMYLGAKIFLNRENPVYIFFLKQHAIIYSLEELNDDIIKDPLSEEEILLNRQIVEKYWSRNVILKKTKDLISTILESAHA